MGDSSPEKMVLPSWRIIEVLPCMRRSARTILPPKAWPMHCIPRQTPRMGISPPKAPDHLEADARLVGVAGARRNDNRLRLEGPYGVESQGVIAVDRRPPVPSSSRYW